MRITQSILLGCFLSISLSSPAVGMVASYRRCQEELKVKVSGAVGLFPKEAEASRKQLISFGEDAIPFVLEIVQSDVNLDPIKKAFLIDVVASIRGEKSGLALISLLSDSDPYARGLAATYIDNRKLRTAIPYLIALLNDQAVYKTIVQTDRNIERNILVRDVAIDALQGVTGKVLASHSSREKQAKAWQAWWDKKQKLIMK